jgi:manganese/zinc/iron transport system permease protein
VLVSALLIIPAATASLLTDRLHHLLHVSAALGAVAAVAGVFLSFCVERLAAGATIVLCSAVLFAVAFCCNRRDGWALRWWQQRVRERRVRRENLLKAFYRSLEDMGSVETGRALPVAVLARRSGQSQRSTLRRLAELKREESVELSPDGWALTSRGLADAAQVVRKHRLWELYLTQRVHYQADHVHADAEKMEHLLTEENAARLWELLGRPVSDPHGRPIPPAAGELAKGGGVHA